jgi:hypothetical protein
MESVYQHIVRSYASERPCLADQGMIYPLTPALSHKGRVRFGSFPLDGGRLGWGCWLRPLTPNAKLAKPALSHEGRGSKCPFFSRTKQLQPNIYFMGIQ